MADEWLEMKAEEFCSSVRDGTHDSPKPVKSGKFLVTSRHIIGGHLDLANAYLISQHDFDAINKRSKVDQWDVLISMIGTVGEACLVKEKPDFAIKNIGLFKTKDEIAGKWLYYYLRSPSTQQLIRETSRGTTQQYIPLGALRDLPVPVPPTKEQRAIAHILGTLDDKIELNRRRNQTLEAMARALFKDWFIDFGPVRAKMEGREPYLPADIWQLFPERLDDDGKPEGWRCTTLANFASLNPESWTKKNAPLDIRYVDLSNTKQGIIEGAAQILWAEAPSRAQRILRPGDTIVGTVRPGNKSFALIGTDGMTGSTGFAVLRPLQRKLREIVFLAATSPENIERLSHLADGAAYPAVRPDVVIESPIIAPRDGVNTDVLDCFSATTSGWLDSIECNKQESQSLSKLRDNLLPELLSGDLRISGIERFIERTVI